MSKEPDRLSSLRRWGSAVFALYWLAGIAAVVAAGFSVDGYKLHVMNIPLPHAYPVTGVVTTSVVLTLELVLTYAVIRPATYDKSWVRALCAVVVAATAFLGSLITLMHSPPYVGAHCFFLLCLTGGLSVLFLATVALRLQSWRRARRG